MFGSNIYEPTDAACFRPALNRIEGERTRTWYDQNKIN